MTTRRVGIGAAIVLALSWLVAERGPVRGEIGTTELLNDLPDPLIDVLEVVMQLGARPAIALVALVAAVLAGQHPFRVALVVVVAGLVAWFAAGVIKDLVERPRPRDLGANVTVLDGATGFGFPSSHVSVATASLVAAAAVTRRRPDLALAVGGVVGVARVAVGVHLPLDVVGGLALGTVVAVVTVETSDRFR